MSVGTVLALAGRNPFCYFCAFVEESINHMLFSCPQALKVWDFIRNRWPQLCWPRSTDSIKTMLQFNPKLKKAKAGKHSSISIVAHTCWEILQARNAKVFEDKVLDTHYTALKAMAETEAYLNLDIMLSSRGVSFGPPRPISTSPSWEAPPLGVHKLNFELGMEQRVSASPSGITLAILLQSGLRWP